MCIIKFSCAFYAAEKSMSRNFVIFALDRRGLRKYNTHHISHETLTKGVLIMKKSIIAVAVLALGVMIASNAQAYNRAYVKDLADNDANFVDLTCPPGSKLIGFGYFDFNNDAADAATPVCEGAGGEHVYNFTSDRPSGGSNEVIEQTCNRDETVWGVSFKDRSDKDAMDGLRTICKNKKTGELRYTYNKDTEGGPQYVDITTNGAEIIGVSYKDGGGGIDGDSSDYADGVTVIMGSKGAVKTKAAKKAK